jgi:hypothetical protein
MGADEEGTLAQLKACRRQLVDRKIAEYRGRIVKTTGDGMLVEFASVVDAVACAAAIQRANDLAPTIAEIKDEGITSLNGIAHALTAREIPTPLAKSTWTAAQVKRVLRRLEEGGRHDA